MTPDVSMTNSDAQPGPRRLTRAMLATKKNSLGAAQTFDADSPLPSQAATTSETGMVKSAPTSQDGVDAIRDLSAVANHGSAQPSQRLNPLLRTYEPPQRARLDWQHHDTREMEQVVEEPVHDEQDEGVEEVETEEGNGLPKVGEGRVIAIDIDHLCDAFASPDRWKVEVETHTSGDQIHSAFVHALTEIHALGLPVHLITARPEQDRPGVIAWVERQGITVGSGDEDIVKAVWFLDGFVIDKTAVSRVGTGEEVLPVPVKSGVGNNEEEKIEALRAINAAVFIGSAASSSDSMKKALKATPTLQCLLLDEAQYASGGPPRDSTPDRAEAGLEVNEQGEQAGTLMEDYQVVEGWEEAVKSIKQWDESGAKGSSSRVLQ